MNEIPTATLRSVFKGLGLDPEHADLYQATLELGAAPVSVLSQTTKIPQASVYQRIKDLDKLGLIESTPSPSKGKTYSAKDPEHLVALIDNRASQIERAGDSLYESLNGLKTIYHSHKPNFPQISYHSGDEEIMSALKQAYESNMLLLFRQGRSESGNDSEPNYISEFHRELNFRQIKTKIICDYNQYSKEFKQEYASGTTQIVLIPGKLGEKNAYTDKIILATKVIYIIHDDRVAITLENNGIADQEKGQFEMLWQENHDRI
jgi:sugar-specific transcriptional regulator TrmB